MPQPILVATDLSERSDRALHRAVTLARDMDCPLVVLHVMDDAMPEDMADALRGKAEARLERQCAAVAEGVDCDLRVVLGDPTGQILKALGSDAPMLLVMGTHRPRPFLDGLRETTMMRIVRRGDCPALVVRDPGEARYETVLAACDFSPACDAAIDLAARIAPGAAIHPVHALHVPYSGMLAPSGGGVDAVAASFVQDAETRAAAWTPPVATRPVRVVTGPAQAVLWREAESLSAHLICCGAHGRAGAAPALLGSLANDLMRESYCDVLIARPG